MRTSWLSLVFVFGLGFVFFLTTAEPVLVAQAPDAPEQTPFKPKSKTKLKRQQILQLLTENFDSTLLQKHPPKIGEFLNWLRFKIEGQKGTAPPFSVDTDSFKAENPDAPPIEEVHIKFPALPPQTTIGEILEIALAQVPTGNATYLIRQGKVEITTDSRAFPQSLLSQSIFAMFKNTPFTEALEELSEQTGIGFIIDPRIGGKAHMPVTATFPNNTAYEVAVIILTNMIGVEAILLRDVVYFTTPANAQLLRPLQQQLQTKEVFKKNGKKDKVVGPMVPGLPGALP